VKHGILLVSACVVVSADKATLIPRVIVTYPEVSFRAAFQEDKESRKMAARIDIFHKIWKKCIKSWYASDIGH